MKLFFTCFRAFPVLPLLFVLTQQSSAQTNLALTAVAFHSGGGQTALGYGPELYNNNAIPAYGSTGTGIWGWVSTGQYIEFTWSAPVTVAKVKLYKETRNLGSCTLQYWDGATYQNIMSYSNPASGVQVDSMVFIPVTTVKIRMFNCQPISGQVNPNHREIQIFSPNSPNDLSLVNVLTPANNVQVCYNTPVTVKVTIFNSGTNPQSNFNVKATFSGITNTTLTNTYTGTLASFASDTFTIGTFNGIPGSFQMRAYTSLPNDGYPSNDSSVAIGVTVLQPVPAPDVISDTVCPGGTAYIYPDPQPGVTYNWYTTPAGGSPVFTGPDMLFPNLPGDTVLYVSAFSGGCESDRSLISAGLGAPPVVNFGGDTSFCESIPLVLNAGNPGGTYVWSTGDSVQSITITDQSGVYWVEVDHYCITSDTIVVDIAPTAKVTGISYVREANTYHFTPSGPQNVDNYLWIFGDGFTSTQMDPVHTYAMSITWNLDVKLVVSNDCGPDTVVRTVPTAVGELSGVQEEFSLYPNPVSSEIFLSVKQAKAEELVVVNALGAVVWKESWPQGKSEHRINTSALAPGNYSLRVRTDRGFIHRTFSIVR